MTKLSIRLEALAKEEGAEDRAHFLLAAISDNLKTASAHMSRRFYLIVLTAGLFVLLSIAEAETINFAGLDFKDLDLIRKVIPLFVAYLYYSCLSWFSIWGVLQSSHHALIRGLYEDVSGHDLEKYVLPTNDLMHAGMIQSEAEGKISDLIVLASAPVFLVIFLGPVAFAVGAYIVLFNQFGWSSIDLIVTAVISIYLIVQGGLILFGAMIADKNG